MENREFLDEVQNHVHNRLHPEQGCSSSADAPNSAQREKNKIRCHDPLPKFSQQQSPGTKEYKDKKTATSLTEYSSSKSRKN
jgi:hypothetical protein